MSSPVLIVGDAAVDLSFWKAERTHVANGSVRVTRGGAAANTAAAVARLGVAASFLGAVGADDLGRFVRRNLDADGVDTRHLGVIAERQTPQVLYAIDSDGSILANAVWPPLTESAVFGLRLDDVDQEALQAHSWLHVVGLSLLAEPLRETALGVMELAREAGIPVSLDLNLRSMEDVDHAVFLAALHEAILRSTVILGSADHEFGYLYPKADPEEAAARLADEGRVVVLRMAEQGAVAVTADERLSAGALPIDAVSPVGAGDAFNAGFICASLTDGDIGDALRHGTVTAGLTLADRDGMSPTAAEVAASLDQVEVLATVREPQKAEGSPSHVTHEGGTR